VAGSATNPNGNDSYVAIDIANQTNEPTKNIDIHVIKYIFVFLESSNLLI